MKNDMDADASNDCLCLLLDKSADDVVWFCVAFPEYQDGRSSAFRDSRIGTGNLEDICAENRYSASVLEPERNRLMEDSNATEN